MTIAETVSDIDALKQQLVDMREDLNHRIAYIIQAQDELAQVRSDIISELGQNPNDSYLKALFVSGLDLADRSLRRAAL